MNKLQIGLQKAQKARDLLRNNKKRSAFKLLNEAVLIDDTLPTLTRVGTTFMWARAYDEAQKIYRQMIEKYPVVDEGFQWSGVVNWLLDDYEQAVRLWRMGLDCSYRDAAGGMDLPLFLYFAAVRIPNIEDINSIKQLIRKRLKSPWAQNWPAPLGRFVIGKTTEKDLREDLSVLVDEPATLEETARIDFYMGVAALKRGDKESYLEALRRCAEAQNLEELCEFYLARWEFDKGD